jgi:hypothetical protein
MQKIVWLPAFMVLALWAMPARAEVDYSKIDRAIAKEPAYQSKTPRYFLLVFGADAKTRIWCVLDGETLYIDKNGSGDLSEPGKAVKSKDGGFIVDAVADQDGKTKHTGIRMHRTPTAHDGKQEEMIHIAVDVNDRYRQYCFVRKMANRADEAPIVHFGGPLRFDVRQSEQTTLVRGDKPAELSLCIVTHPPNGEWVAIDHGKGVPADVHPIAEIVFPGKTPDAAPVKVKVPITQRC